MTTTAATTVDTARTTKARLPSLTGYRFLLAFAVLLGHTFFSSQIYQSSAANKVLAIIEPPTFMAVSSFFILSGFVLTWSYRPGLAARSFWRRRFFKIWPNHALAWALILVFFAIVAAPTPIYAFQNHATFGEAVASLFLVQAWIDIPAFCTGTNPVAWSISCEALFYLLFPLLIIGVRKINERHLWWWVLGVAVLILAIPLPTYAIHGPDAYPWAHLPSTQLWLVYAFPPARVPEFVLGMLLARLVRAGKWPRIPSWVAVIPIVLLILGAGVIPVAYMSAAACALPCALMIPTIARIDVENRRSWLRRAFWVALGSASYALYLIHAPLLYWLRDVVGATKRFDVLTATLLCLAFIVIAQVAAWLVYRYWEAPIMRRFSRPMAKQ